MKDMWLRRTFLPCFEALKSHKVQCIPSSSYSNITNKKGKIAPLQERKMVDRFRLWAKGGEGGNGCFSFRRSRHDRRGKPDGGNGGRGGDVILECSAAVWDFSNLQHHLNAKRGGHGVSKNKIGSRGADKVALVPVGTVIHLVNGEVPSVVESCSVTALHPWEIPENVEVNPSTFDQNSNACNLNAMGVTERLETEDFNNSSTLKEHMDESPSIQLFVKDSSSENEMEFEAPSEDSIFSEEDESINGSSEMEMEVEEAIRYSVAELIKPGQRIIVARGGDGGLGNASLGKASKSHKCIKYRDITSDTEISSDEDHSSLAAGSPGSEAVLVLELKSIADVGLVGMPNAGKSTLLGAISKAKPVIGHYAFTTLRPNIGNLNFEDFFSVTVADIPGLIKGAHKNRGLGHAFLRHIERTKVLAYVVDLAAALDGRKGTPPWEQLRDLVLELEYHRAGLSDRPSLVVANKIDEEGAKDVYEELKRRVPSIPIYPVCAVLEEGVPELKEGLRRLVDGAESQSLKLSEIAFD